MKTLIVFPDKKLTQQKKSPIQKSIYFPLGITSLASFLLKEKKEVSLLDCRISSLDEIENSINDSQIIGISSNSFQTPETFCIAEIAKNLGKTVIVGGPHATLAPDYFLKNAAVDYVVMGEGELTFSCLLNSIESGNLLDNIPGVGSKKNGEINIHDNRKYIEDLDILPFPARHLLPWERYKKYSLKRSGSSVLTMTISRGCPFACSFCAKEIFGRTVRIHSSEYIVQELKKNLYDYNPDYLFFIDDLFTINRKTVVTVCEDILKQKINFSWGCEARVDTIDYELLSLMKHAGLREIWFGIESGSQKVLDSINKSQNVKQCYEAVELSKKAGIPIIHIFIIIGAPAEDKNDLKLTQKLIYDTSPDSIQISFFTPLPGTPSFSQLSNEISSQLPDNFSYTDDYIIKHPNFTASELRKFKNYITLMFKFKRTIRYLLDSRKILFILSYFIPKILKIFKYKFYRTEKWEP